MVVTHRKASRKPSGGKYVFTKTKRLHHKGSKPTNTRIGKQDARSYRAKGGSIRKRLLFAEKANVYDPATKKYEVAQIKTVVENSANRHFVRRNIMTKGAVIETSKGKAKITNRPSQEGFINAVLIK